MTLLLAAAAALVFIGWVVAEPFIVERRREKLRSRAFPAAWREILLRHVPHYLRLPGKLRAQLERHVQVFLAEKSFAGCDGFEVTDEVRVTIAAQACLLLLNRQGEYFPRLSQVLVYPGPFIVERLHVAPGVGTSMLQSDAPQVLSGESWTQGQVVLSWTDVLEGAAIADDGRNVVIHEFAHQLDQEKGYANGAPWLGRRDRYPQWSRVLGAEFARLQQQSLVGEASLLGPYAATNPAEFFAVASEVFFERPQAMAAMHPELYAELSRLYRVDPATW